MIPSGGCGTVNELLMTFLHKRQGRYHCYCHCVYMTQVALLLCCILVQGPIRNMN